MAGAARADAEQPVQRAEADEAGEERHEPDEAPQGLRADDDEGEEHDPEHDPQPAIDRGFIQHVG